MGSLKTNYNGTSLINSTGWLQKKVWSILKECDFKRNKVLEGLMEVFLADFAIGNDASIFF